MIDLQKLPQNVGDLGKLIVVKGIKKLPKVQKIAQSGYTSQFNIVTLSRLLQKGLFVWALKIHKNPTSKVLVTQNYYLKNGASKLA